LSISRAKAERLRRLATADGVIAAVAVDQRKSLRQMIASAAGTGLDDISDEQLGQFKTAVARVLTKHASAVLIDPEFGSSAFGARTGGAGLLMTYEMDGYENPRPHRMLALMPHLSVYRLREMGADGVKILLSWTPFDTPESNNEKRAMIERIGAECAALDMPFFLEPVGYDPGGLDPKSAEFARIKPNIVVETMKEFSLDKYGVDVLKVEFPVSAAFVPDVWTREQALGFFRAADQAATRPYIYLSAGVDIDRFTGSLELAAASGARFSGVLCGRASWQGGVPVFAREGREAFERWLEAEGVRNVQAINDCLRAAAPWTERLRAA
jgi:tagatose 1,6-diphosphate aldolase